LGRNQIDKMKFDPNISYETTCQLFAEHDSKTPTEYARQAYDRTDCGVWTSFITKGGTIPSADLAKHQDTPEWAARNIVGVLHGTIVEGTDAEFEADPLLFPFGDEDLADAWQYLEGLVDGSGIEW